MLSSSASMRMEAWTRCTARRDGSRERRAIYYAYHSLSEALHDDDDGIGERSSRVRRPEESKHKGRARGQPDGERG